MNFYLFPAKYYLAGNIFEYFQMVVDNIINQKILLLLSRKRCKNCFKSFSRKHVEKYLEQIFVNNNSMKPNFGISMFNSPISVEHSIYREVMAKDRAEVVEFCVIFDIICANCEEIESFTILARNLGYSKEKELEISG